MQTRSFRSEISDRPLGNPRIISVYTNAATIKLMINNNPPNGKTEIYIADRVCLHDDDDNDYLTAKYYYYFKSS